MHQHAPSVAEDAAASLNPDGDPKPMTWVQTRLTNGTAAGRFHSHSYYDIPVFDAESRRVVLYRTSVAGRHPSGDDTIEIGVIDVMDPARRWTPIGESRAWSVQQGPMAQWVGGDESGGSQVIWNDREDGRIVARVHDLATGRTRTLPRAVYAVDPDGRHMLSLNLLRLNTLRPGYGYPGDMDDTDSRLDRKPDDDGVWRVDLETGDAALILSLKRAVRFLMRQLGLRSRLGHLRRRYIYWFNHAKLSPDGTRFTVKLRFRVPGGPWNEAMGYSLTCGVDGRDLRLLAPATSHVIWYDGDRLYFWQQGKVRLFRDAGPGTQEAVFAPSVLDANVHIRQIPGLPDRFVFDTPYREEIDVCILDLKTGQAERIAQFGNHTPAKGPFRCDLHPVPSPDGQHILVTTLEDGGRQVHLLSRSD